MNSESLKCLAYITQEYAKLIDEEPDDFEIEEELSYFLYENIVLQEHDSNTLYECVSEINNRFFQFYFTFDEEEGLANFEPYHGIKEVMPYEKTIIAYKPITNE